MVLSSRYVAFLKRTAAAVVIQKNVRMWAAKRSYQRRRAAAVAVQALLRAHVARKTYRQVTRRCSKESWSRKQTAATELFRWCWSRRL